MGPGKIRGGAGGRPAPPASRPGVEVSEEERRHLIECCAFFHAARFRPAQPGGYRREDLAEAATSIDTILAKHKGTRRADARRVPLLPQRKRGT